MWASSARGRSVAAPRTVMPPVWMVGVLSVRRTVAVVLTVSVTWRTGGMTAIIAGARRGRSFWLVLANAVPGWTVSRSVPRRSSWATRLALDDSETPMTATSAAIPTAIPRTASAARRRPVRSPVRPILAASAGFRRELDGGLSCMVSSGDDGGQLRLVGDHGPVADLDRARDAVGAQLHEELEDRVAGVGVEVSGRLVGEHEGRVADERAGDRDALALPARQLRRGVGRARRQPDAIERSACARQPLAAGDSA